MLEPDHSTIKTRKSQPKRRGIYILPNLLTTGALFFGFFAIIQATMKNFETAAIAVLIALILDGLDGRVARLTNTSSEFGKEFDSLSDVICFGLAPALMLFEWSLSAVGKIGWLCAFVYVAATALRLARFNTYSAAEPGFFQGLPCPPAAAFLVTWMWVIEGTSFSGSTIIGVVTTILISAMAIGMVSSIPYLSFKNLDLKGRIPFVAAIAMVFAIALISFDPPRVLFIMLLAYAVSGPILWMLRKLKKKRKSSIKKEEN